MKIALGIREFLPEKGGAERYCYDLMNFLVGEGLEGHVYSSIFPEEEGRLIFHRVPVVPHPESLNALSFAVNCRRMMRRKQFDVIVGVGDTLYADVLQPHGGVHWKWFWKGIEGYRRPFPWVFKFLGRALSPKQWVKGFIEDAPYRKVKKIIAVSEMVKRDMLNCYHIPEDKVAVIYNGVDTELFHPRNKRHRKEIRERFGIMGNELLLLFVSNNFRLRGLRYVIGALALVRREGVKVKLLVVGRDRKKHFVKLAKRLGCDKEVIFAGGATDLYKYYGSADILVHPSAYDACSLVVLEALSSGLSVITTKHTGAGWLIKNGREGFVLDSSPDANALAEKILALANADRLRRARSAARALGRNHSQSKNFSKVAELLLEEQDQEWVFDESFQSD